MFVFPYIIVLVGEVTDVIIGYTKARIHNCLTMVCRSSPCKLGFWLEFLQLQICSCKGGLPVRGW